LRAALRLGLLTAVAVILADQASKVAVLYGVMSPEPRIVTVTDFFNLVLVWNQGASFGLFKELGESGSIILTVLAVAISIGLGFWMARAQDRLTVVALGLVIGGAIGNAIDRIRFGAVVDFLDFHAYGYHWPAFNAADTAISVGVVLLLWESLFARGESPK
jgi:signal peptidase II